MKLHATIGWHDFWSRDHQVKNDISQFSQRYNDQTWLEYMIPLFYFTWFIINRFLHPYMSFLYVMWSHNLLKLYSPTSKKSITTEPGGNTYKNEGVAYLHMTWVNHAKVNTQSQQATSFLIIWYPNKWKKHTLFLQKLLDIKFDRKKRRKQYIYSLGSKFMINAASKKTIRRLR